MPDGTGAETARIPDASTVRSRLSELKKGEDENRRRKHKSRPLPQ